MLMASRLSPAPLRASFLHLPPTLPVAAFQRSQISRSFSSTPAQRINASDVALFIPNSVLDGLHATGLPWWAVIPATAVVVQTGLLWKRSDPSIVGHLFPLVYATISNEKRFEAARRTEAKRENPEREKILQALDGWNLRVQNFKLMQSFKTQFKMPGILSQTGIDLLALMAFAETIRMKSGASTGLLTEFGKALIWIVYTLDPNSGLSNPYDTPNAASQPYSSLPLDEQIEVQYNIWRQSKESAQQATQVPQEANPSTLLSNNDPLLPPAELAPNPEAPWPTATTSPYYDPSLATEGTLWFPDLTVPDPGLVTFPLVLLLLHAVPIFTAAYRRAAAIAGPSSSSSTTTISTTDTTTPTPTTLPTDTPLDPAARRVLDHKPSPPLFKLLWSERLRLTFTILLCWIVPYMPAGVALYFVSSIAAQKGLRRWRELKRPAVPPVRPCVRMPRMGGGVGGGWQDI